MLLFILLLVPNIYLYIQNEKANIFLLSLLILIFILSIIKNSRYFLVFFPFFIFLPAVLFYIHFYRTVLDEQILSIILETNVQEVKSFLGAYLNLYIYSIIIWVGILVLIFYNNQKKPLIWSHPSRSWIVFLCSFYFLGIYYINQNIADQIDQNFTNKNENFLIEEENHFRQDLKQTYPIGLVISIFDLYREQQKINKEFTRNSKFKFHPQIKIKNNRQIIVLVIGETSRRSNWQLNGYYRKTNPYLSQQKNLINFSDMISISNTTRTAIPMLITRKPAEKVFNYNFPEKSVISVFKEAGFKTYWLSTQQKFGAFDTSTSIYAKEADHINFLNKTGYNNIGDTDGILVPKFNKIINLNEKKQFIVIHTLGSHYNYVHRYPKDFDKFYPSLNTLQYYSMQDKRYKKELLNSYDNSILYTDYVLNQFIEILKKQQDAETFLFYISDHGEDLFDGECNKTGHGNQTLYNFEIASFIWYSDLFALNNIKKQSNLKNNKYKKIDQTTVFPTLVDAGDVKLFDDNLERSLLKSIASYPRLIMSGVNYDHAKVEKICREIN